jgi:hypothetical protein
VDIVRFTEAHVSRKVIWKRQISVLRKLGKIEQAVEELASFVETFYTDVEAWLELADLYASLHQYASLLIGLVPAYCVLTPMLGIPWLRSLCHMSCY